MTYKIVIWVYGTIEDTYESDDIQDALKWYRDNWSSIWDNGGCSFSVYENDNWLSFEEKWNLGFYQ